MQETWTEVGVQVKQKMTTAVVVPCYRVKKHVAEVLATVPSWIDRIIVVDDKCPELTGKYVQETCCDPRVEVLFNPENLGVGGAVIVGFERAVTHGSDIIVKMDGDGQMDARYLQRLISPLRTSQADLTKGNRFFDLEAMQQMPLIRRVGNFSLTILTKFASGHWHISDPTNGYFAMRSKVFEILNKRRLDRGYFFETSLLIQLNVVNAMVVDVPIPARYGDEVSSLDLGRALITFPWKLFRGLVGRVLWKYFIYDISPVSVFSTLGILVFTCGVSFGAWKWIEGALTGRAQTAGTVSLAILPIILGFQMILQALLLDVIDRPTRPVSDLLVRPERGEDRDT
jgi:dolichol-phosphate mannosyltransferase